MQLIRDVAADNAGVQSSVPTPVDDCGWYWVPLGGLKYDSVTGVTGAACLWLPVENPFARYREDGTPVTVGSLLLMLQAEAGRGGGKLQIGCGAWHFTGWALKLSLLRTWGETMAIDPGQTYLGAECQLNILLLNGTIGLYTEIKGDGENRTLVTWSIGIGF